MTESILKDIQRMIIKSLILKAIGLFTGGAQGGTAPDSVRSSGDAFMPAFKNAKGGTYSGAGISAFSNQVVNKPTLFPFAKGTGLMGEAGEEAIMPLTRMKSGNLGVETEGGSGSSTVVTNISVNIDQNGEVQQETKANETDGKAMGELLSSAVNQQLIKEMRPGGLLNRSGN